MRQPESLPVVPEWIPPQDPDMHLRISPRIRQEGSSGLGHWMATPPAFGTALLLVAAMIPGCSPQSPPPTAEETRKVLSEAGERLQQGAASAAAVARETAREASRNAEDAAQRATEETRRAVEAAARNESVQRLKSAGSHALQSARTQAESGVAAARKNAGKTFQEASELATKTATTAREQAQKLAAKARETIGAPPSKP